jgi:cytochrome c
MAFGGISVPGLSLALEGDPIRGEILFKACSNCHEVGEGAKNKVGPHLDGIFGRTAGSLDGFNYSGAMKKAGAEGLLWSEHSLEEYIAKPRDFIKGNRMSFRGMDNPQDRKDIVAWLQRVSLNSPSDDPEPELASEVVGFTAAVLEIQGDVAYGEYLSGECVTCHQISGRAGGIPSVVGLPKDYFVRSLFEYKTNIRSNEVMKTRVANLTNEEIAALAAYFASIQPQ